VQAVLPPNGLALQEGVNGGGNIVAHALDFGEDVGLEEDEEGGFLLLEFEGQVDEIPLPVAPARPVLTAEQILRKQVRTL
jgi:hypothetical protein